MTRLAIVDDYLNVALGTSDWSPLDGRCSIDVFDRALGVPDEAADRLAPYQIICTMRERMAFPRELFERLPQLRLLVVTGEHHRRLDLQAATDHGVVVCRTGIGSGYRSVSELTWALILAVARHIPSEDAAVRNGGWQTRLGGLLYGRALGLIGLGNVGTTIAAYGKAFGMELLAWSPNLTAERAAAAGARAVSKDELLRSSDVVSLHVRLSERSAGLIGDREFELMKPSATLINTSRGPLVDETALRRALTEGRIAGAGLDVYDQEPLPPDHPVRSLPNTVLTPHVGYLTGDLFSVFYGETVENVVAWLDGAPIRLLNSQPAS